MHFGAIRTVVTRRPSFQPSHRSGLPFVPGERGLRVSSTRQVNGTGAGMISGHLTGSYGFWK